jgi:ABC-type glycerol-3-phosphate transport system substrate-binding protein
MKKRLIFLGVLILFATYLTGCTGVKEGSKGEVGTESKVPVTLKLYPHQPMTAADFQLLIADPVKKKYPYITVEMIDKGTITLENIIATNTPLDLVTMFNGSFNTFKDLNAFEDMIPLAKKNNFDISRMDPKAITTIKELSDKGELYGVPYNVQLYGLYYNKDIFDKFGIPYPKDGMTWDDTIELTRKLARVDNGVQYSGLDIDTLSRLTYPLSIIPVEARTNKVTVNNNSFKEAFEMGKRIFSIPENPYKLNINRFVKDKTLAMIATVNIFDLLDKSDVNWDVVQYPSYKENPNMYGMYDLHAIMISSLSKHKDEAMKVIEVLLSDEVQTVSSSTTGRLSPLINPEIQKAFGTKMTSLKGKNIAGIFKSKPAYAPPFSIYHSKASDILKKAFVDYIDDKKDVNTALREAEDEITQLIKSEQKK